MGTENVSKYPKQLNMKFRTQKGCFCKRKALVKCSKAVERMQDINSQGPSMPSDHSYSTPPSHSLVSSQYQKLGTEPNTHVNTGVDLEFVVREEIVEADDDIFVDAEINTVKNMVSLEDAGRVVIELEHFFKQLICQKCTVPLQLSKRIGFVHSGVTGYVVIQCQHEPCMYVNRVALSKQHRRANTIKGPAMFDVNTKLSLGM